MEAKRRELLRWSGITGTATLIGAYAGRELYLRNILTKNEKEPYLEKIIINNDYGSVVQFEVIITIDGEVDWYGVHEVIEQSREILEGSWTKIPGDITVVGFSWTTNDIAVSTISSSDIIPQETEGVVVEYTITSDGGVSSNKIV